MGRLDFFIGMIVATLVGAMLFLPALFAEPETTQPAPAARAPVAFVPALAPEPTRDPSSSTPAEPEEVATAPEDETATPDLAPLHEPPGEDATTDTAGADGKATDSEESLPPLVIQWDGPDHIRDVALEKGFKIVAVDRTGKILGELALTGEPRIRKFSSRMADYSNKVRSLPRSLFPGARTDAGTIQEYWLLVTAEEDRKMTAMVRSSIKGVVVRLKPPHEVRIRACYRAAGDGIYSLRLIEVDAPMIRGRR